MLAVIGAGFAGTGTGPLAAALERLGFGPCHDLQALVRQPGLIPAWEEAVDGAIPDWDRLLAGYASTVGWPGCHFWRELADRYPAARLILTLREPHAWYRRASATLFRELAERPPAADQFELPITFPAPVMGWRFERGIDDQRMVHAGHTVTFGFSAARPSRERGGGNGEKAVRLRVADITGSVLCAGHGD